MSIYIIFWNGCEIMLDAKLETLIAVCEKKNFTKAAELLTLTQPAVSHHIKLLEEEMEVKLFNRKKGDLKLTEEGEIVLKYARRFKALDTEMRQEISDAAKLITRLKVGITHTSESNIVAEVLSKYAHMNNGVKIKIVTDAINNLYSMLSNYELDIAIVEGRINKNGINALMLDTDYLVCVMSNNNRLAKKTMVTLNDIKKEKMILRLPDSGTRNLFVSNLENIGMSIEEFDVVLEVDNVATIKDLIKKELGISILARSACVDELKKGKITVLPIENLSTIREMNILYNQDFNHKDILQELTKIYRDTARIYK